MSFRRWRVQFATVEKMGIKVGWISKVIGEISARRDHLLREA